MPTTFDKAMDQAIEAKQELGMMEGSYKLTGEAMLAEAMGLAGIDEERLDDLGFDIDESLNVDYVQAFIRRLIAFYKSPNATRVMTDTGKMVRAYGSEQVSGQIAELKSTVAEVQCIAIRECVKRFKDHFGPVEDFEKHQEHIADLRRRLSEAYVSMQELVSGDDLMMDWNGVTSDEKKAGLVRVKFKRHPGTVMRENWPVDLVDALVNFVGKKPTALKRSKMAA
jgi:hypothetical protein